MLYLSAHQAIQHGNVQPRLIWLYDIYLVLKAKVGDLDWQIMFSKAKKLGWEAALDYVLVQIKDQFDVRLPESYDKISEVNSARSLKQINDPGINIAQTRVLLNIHKLRNFSWKVQFLFLLSIVFPSPSHMIKHYDLKLKLLWPLYYPYRWIDILFDIVRSFSKLISAKSNLTRNRDL